MKEKIMNPSRTVVTMILVATLVMPVLSYSQAWHSRARKDISLVAKRFGEST
jgi:hypothetical protein